MVFKSQYIHTNSTILHMVFCLNNGSYADTTNCNIGVALDTLVVKIEETHSFVTSCVLDLLVTSQPNPRSKKNPLYTQQLFITKAFLEPVWPGSERLRLL